MTLEEQIEEYSRRVYGGDMPAHTRHTMRSVLQKEERQAEKFGELSTRDYIPGYDDGEEKVVKYAR